MTLKTLPYDPADFLDSEAAMEEYLRATCEDGDAREISRALGAVAGARGLTDLPSRVGLDPAALRNALNGDGDLEFATVAKIAEALGFRLSFALAAKSAA